MAAKANIPKRPPRPSQNAGAAPALLSEEMGAAQAMSVVLKRQADQLAVLECGFGYEPDVELVHRMRVATRRIRSGLRIAPEAVRNRLAPLLPRLAKLAGELGAVRDLDVQIEVLQEYRASVAPGRRRIVGEFIALLQQRRRRRFGQLRHTRTTGGSGDLGRRLGEALAGPRGARRGGNVAQAERDDAGGGREQAQMVLGLFARAVLARRLVKVMRFKRRLAKLSPARQHRLRIQCKRLRYSAEFFAEIFGPSLKPAVIKPATNLQDLLGEVHDSHVLEASLETWARARPGRGTGRGTGAKAMRRHLEAWRAGRLATAQRVWDRFGSKAGCRKVRRAMAANKKSMQLFGLGA